MLKRIQLVDFKSFANETIDLAPLTLLVGANASGKSNFLDALWFLHGLTLGLHVDEVLDGEERLHRNGESWPGLRGGSKEASRLGTAQFELRSEWEDVEGCVGEGSEVRCDDIAHSIVCRTRPSPLILDESCGAVGNPPRKLVTEGLLSGVGQGSESGGPATVLAGRGFGLIRQLDIRPERMRDYGQLKRSHLAADGSNFSGALHHLCAEPEERRGVVDWLTELLAPEIVDVEFIEIEELGDVMAMFVESDGTRVSARSLSDGSLRFLGLLLSLRQAPPGTTFLIEEIDSGLHPARTRVLMELLHQATHQRRLQVIATTHDPTCLEYLGDEGLHSAVVFGRVPGHQGTVIRRPGDLPHFDDAVKRRGASDLFATRWLELPL